MMEILNVGCGGYGTSELSLPTQTINRPDGIPCGYWRTVLKMKKEPSRTTVIDTSDLVFISILGQK